MVNNTVDVRGVDSGDDKGASDPWYTRTPDQEQMAAATRGFVRHHAPLRTLRQDREREKGGSEPSPDGEQLWRLMCNQLGGPAIAIPEEYGGLGMGLEEVCALLEEAGAELAFPYLLPMLGQVIPLLIEGAESPIASTMLQDIARGIRVVGLAWLDRHGEPFTNSIRGRLSDGGWRLDGTAALVVEAAVCDDFLVVAQVDDGWRLFAVQAAAPTVRVSNPQSIDPTREVFDVTFDNSVGLEIGFAGDIRPAIQRAQDVAAVCLGAEQLGGAVRCLQLALEYASARHQFDRPIAAFQALQHMCADAHIANEAARSVLYYATWAEGEGSTEFPLAASAAKVACSEAFVRAASLNIQIHGTIGFTDEDLAQRYYRRAKWSYLYGGSPSYHRSRIAELLEV